MRPLPCGAILASAARPEHVVPAVGVPVVPGAIARVGHQRVQPVEALDGGFRRSAIGHVERDRLCRRSLRAQFLGQGLRGFAVGQHECSALFGADACRLAADAAGRTRDQDVFAFKSVGHGHFLVWGPGRCRAAWRRSAYAGRPRPPAPRAPAPATPWAAPSGP
ncbi:hypothetical protein G6F55_013680 [Rhizopus delemar]|nr:hypothetical protein G6F55_013680 [Rhizopus delemar]